MHCKKHMNLEHHSQPLVKTYGYVAGILRLLAGSVRRVRDNTNHQKNHFLQRGKLQIFHNIFVNLIVLAKTGPLWCSRHHGPRAIQILRAHAYVRIRPHIRAHTRAHTCAYTRIRAHTCAYARIRVHTGECISSILPPHWGGDGKHHPRDNTKTLSNMFGTNENACCHPNAHF